MINTIRLVKEFCNLVSIDALPYKEREMAEVLKGYLTELGFEVTEDKAGEYYEGNCGNVYGYLPGTLEGPPLLFSAHMDTVEPGNNKRAIVHLDGTITSDGTTVLGADDLSGVVAILEAIRTIKEQGLEHRSIEVLFTIAEEVYIRGSEVFDYSKIKAKEAYVLDLDGTIGTAAIAAPTLVSFTAKITGRAAHAGFAPEEGIHAIMVAARAINKIKQGRIDENTTVNIGTISGGKAKNVVPDLCVLQGEIRSLSHEKAVALGEEIKSVFDEVVREHEAGLEYTTSFGCIAYEVSPKHSVVKRFEKVCQDFSCETKLIQTFGGSDNNNFLKNGITGIVLACAMHQVHSVKEYTTIKELEKCCSIVCGLMQSKE